MAIQVDTRGKLCPLPLIMFRQSIKEHPYESQFEVLTDNDTSCGNLRDFIHDHNYSYTEEKTGNVSILHVEVTPSKEDSEVKSVSKATVQATSLNTERGVTIQIDTNHMGHGDDELGEILILSFLNTLLGNDELPKEIICYNSGVKLAMEGTETAIKLKELEEKGVSIILCGTCVDFYQLKEQIKLGHITNMLSIYEHLSSAERIVKP